MVKPLKNKFIGKILHCRARLYMPRVQEMSQPRGWYISAHGLVEAGSDEPTDTNELQTARPEPSPTVANQNIRLGLSLLLNAHVPQKK